jgi:prevent-host-death family protein
MKFATASELNRKANSLLRLVTEESDQIIITRDGKPVALLSQISDDDFSDFFIVRELGLPSKKKINKSDYLSHKEVFDEVATTLALQSQSTKRPQRNSKTKTPRSNKNQKLN